MKIQLMAREHAGTHCYDAVALMHAAGWEQDTARQAIMRVSSIDNLKRIIASAHKLPERIRAVILANRDSDEADLVRAFTEASEIEATTRLFGSSAPEAFSSMRAYVQREDNGAERLMTIHEAKTALAKALADADVYIDTTRPADASANALQRAVTAQYGPGVPVHGAGEGRPVFAGNPAFNEIAAKASEKGARK